LELHFGLPHDPGFVALSVVMAIFGGYVGLGLAGQARTANGLYRRGLLAGAAWSLGLGIWTMHFVGMLAAQLPAGTLFSILLTLLSFLLCVLVVGIAAFICGSIKPDVTTAVVGTAGQRTPCARTISHAASCALHTGADHASQAMARCASSVRPDIRPGLSALNSARRISTLYRMGTMIVRTDDANGLATVQRRVVVVALLAAVISGVFVVQAEKPRNRKHHPRSRTKGPPASHSATLVPSKRRGHGYLPADCAIQATTHYTLIYDGRREHFSPWSITEAEERLDKGDFMRVHRSHLIAIDKVKALRKSGDGAVVEVGSLPRIVPVSRNHYAELKSRLGLHLKVRLHGTSQQKL
jgi:hypothetical protein